jgi:predicted DNA-binding transcriptional regulator AlpA
MKSPKIKRRPPLPRPKMQRVSNDSDDESPAQHSTTTPIRFMSKAEVAAAIGVSPVMIWKWCVAGAFPFGKEVGGKTCWRSDEIARWQNQRPDARVKGGV